MKRFIFILSAFAACYSLSAQEVRTDAHASNHRTWSIGINGGNTFSMGDATSFDGDKGAGVPDLIGSISMGLRGHLTKFINPTFGIQGSAGYHQISGSQVNTWFSGDYLDGDLSAVINLSNLMLQGRTYERRSAFLFSAGVGVGLFQGRSYVTPTDDISSTNGLAAVGQDDRAIQVTVPVALNYKYKLTNAWDIDGIFKWTFIPEDFPDAVFSGATGDAFAYLGVGLSYNFGKDADKQSIVYINPLDKMYADMEEVKNNFNKLTTDDDKDGVNNYFDKENNTPEGSVVDGSGKALDVDADGIPDYMDEDPYTAKGAQVDSKGRAVDSDGDGVADYMDEEPNTPEGTMVNFQGKTLKVNGSGTGNAYIPSVFFAFNSATVTAANYERLAVIAKVMNANSDMKLKVVGYTDKVGSEEYNKNLGMRRAEAVVKALNQTFGIDESRFMTESAGKSNPLAENRNDVNRRADLMPQ